MGTVGEYASPLEEWVVNASLVSLLEEFSIGSIRGDSLIKVICRHPHLAERSGCWIFPECLLQGVQAAEQEGQSVARHFH